MGLFSTNNMYGLNEVVNLDTTNDEVLIRCYDKIIGDC